MEEKIIFSNDFIKVVVEESEIPWLKIFSKNPYKEFSYCDRDTKLEILKCLDVIEKEMITFFNPEKINIASFGNYFPHVHFHIMARFKEDSFFPEPMWGQKQRESKLKLKNIEFFYENIRKNLS